VRHLLGVRALREKRAESAVEGSDNYGLEAEIVVAEPLISEEKLDHARRRQVWFSVQVEVGYRR
jgi:hypothetical protein